MTRCSKVKNLLIKTAGVLCIAAATFFFKADSYAMNNVAGVDSKISKLEGEIASLGSFDGEAAYLEEWIKANGYGNHEVLHPRKMYTPDGDYIAVCFDIDQTGYIIINTINYDIMEYSFNKRIDSHSNTLIYAGFTSVFEKIDANRFVSVDSGEVISAEAMGTTAFENLDIQRKPLSQKLFNMNQKAPVAEKNGGNGYYESGDLSKALATWDTGYSCQVDAAAILLKYLYDNVSSSFLPSGYTKDSKVQNYLCTYRYMVDAGMTSYQAVNGGASITRYSGAQLETVINTGIKQYLKDRGLRKWSATSSSYSFNTIKLRINENRPVSLGVNGEKQGKSWGNHQVVVHGYWVGYDGVPYVKVNDTFTRNGVSLNGSASYYNTYDMWYIR